MKICHISTNDVAGGAARAAYRLHQGLQNVGQDSCVYSLNKQSRDLGVRQYKYPQGLISRARCRLRQRQIIRAFALYQSTRPVGLELFSDDRSVVSQTLFAQMPRTDIINLHWVAGFVDYQSFFSSLAPGQPIVWTLHDMNPFTGGCHYASGCERYRQQCGACPQLGSEQADDLSRKVWQRKAKALSHLQPDQLHIVAPSRWLADQAQQSSIFSRFAVSVIPNGVDISVFKPCNRSAIREQLDIPQDAKVLLFIADSVTNKRKGFIKLLKAIEMLATYPNLFLLSVGSGETISTDGVRALHLGSIQNDQFLAAVYSAADLFVIPSLEDNLPNTVLEAMACGTPVVGFNIGGIPDMVRPNVTGLLAPAGDVQALGEAILCLLEDPTKQAQMSVTCHHLAIEQYALEIQAHHYVKLYEEMIEKSHA